jgi:hypothetical protein
VELVLEDSDFVHELFLNFFGKVGHENVKTPGKSALPLAPDSSRL